MFFPHATASRWLYTPIHLFNSLHGTHPAALALLLLILKGSSEVFWGLGVSHGGHWNTVPQRVKEWPTCQRPTWNGISTGSGFRIPDRFGWWWEWEEHVKLVACPHARYSLSWAEPIHQPSEAPGPPNNQEREIMGSNQLPKSRVEAEQINRLKS
jgi:hypothetical protein